MGEPKPLASLTSGLLARKGGARPAMRRQPLGSGPVNPGGNGYDDLGWNDMGYDVDPVQSAEGPSRVDIKPLLTGSMPAHNVDAEAAVDAAEQDFGGAGDFSSVTPLPWASDGMGDAAAEVPEVVRQQEVLQVRVGTPRAEAQSVPQSEPQLVQAPEVPDAIVPAVKAVGRASKPRRAVSEATAREKAAFTLRLDAERHLRLRLASAIYNRSAQQILIDVLDEYLSQLPEIDAMASRLPASPSNRKPTHSFVGEDQ
jgi:hypothetical protein